MRVSIVIPAHNAAETLHDCLAACTSQSHADCEIIVVDDGSRDATTAIAREFGVTVLQQNQRGPAAARNAGARAATGDILAFTDSDCVPHPDWIAQLVAALDGAAAAGGTYGIANPHSTLARLIHAEIQMRHAAYGDRIDFAGSFNMAIRRDMFLMLEGFDENFSAASAEDNDLSYRLLDAGHAIRFARAAVVDHYHPTRLQPYLATQMRHGFWRAKLYAKHPARKSGDRYADGLELWMPIFSTGLLGIWLAQLVMMNLYANLIVVLGLVAVFIYRVFSAARIARTDRTVPVLYAAVALVLRDVARGIGMIRGVWHFLIARRVTA